MPRSSASLLAFNRGLVSRLGLARVDVKRIASFSAEEMTNFIPRVLGPMSIRPGWKYLGSTHGDLESKLIPFVFSVDDTALIEISADTLRVWRNDELIERGSVGTGVTNGTFNTDLADWTDADESGAASTWATGGYMQLLGDGTQAAIRYQAVSVSGGDANDEHALRITITKGPVMLRVGSALGSDNYINETALGTGTHSLTFTPSGNFYVYLFSRLSRPVLVDSVAIEAAGVMEVDSPWSASDLDFLRWDQSGDILFVACQDQQQYQIERRSLTSWSVVKYEPEDGPFRIENTSTVTLTPSAITGEITLTASKPFFRTTHVGALFSLTSEGQEVTSNLSAANTFTNAVRITGVDASRVFSIVLTGTWVGTATLQRSLESETGPWEDISAAGPWTANTTEAFDDGLDNQIAWYRVGFKAGQYTSGTLAATLIYALGSITGVARVTAYTSSLVVTADVLSDLGGTPATEIWAEGAWSDFRGWPTAVALHEGRLWWAGKSKVWGSFSDAYDSFDPNVEGDAGPISRTLGSGPVDRVNWLFSGGRLLMGGDLNEYAARSSSLDEPLTPTAFQVKSTSSQGSAAMMSARIDSKAIFANRTGMRVYENAPQPSAEYQANDLCQLVPDIGDPGIVRVVTQRQPDTRIHAIRSDGTVALAIFDRAEDVLGWCEVETDGEVEDAAVLPAQAGVTDDYIYYIVKREIDGATVRYLEKWAQASEGVGGLGSGGTGSPFTAFSLGVFADVDQTASVQIHYSPYTGKIYAIGTNTDKIWVYDPATFPAYTQIDTSAFQMRPPGQSGCMSQDGRYFFLSGDTGGAGPCPVRVVDLSTGVITALGANADTICIGANDTYLIVYEASSTRAYTYDIGAGTRTLAATWAVASFSSVLNEVAWDASGAFWIINDAKNVIRIKPITAGYTQFAAPIIIGTQIESQAEYDSVRNRLLFSFNDGTIRALSDWTVGVNDSGTWTTVFASQRAVSLQVEPVSDTLFVWDYHNFIAKRIYMPTLGTIDTILLQDTSGPDNPQIDYNMRLSRPTVYIEGPDEFEDAYGLCEKAGTQYLVRLRYAGAPILYDADGNSLQSGGVVGRINALADSFIEYTGPNVTSVAVAHLEGEEVVVWANGVDLGTDENYAQTYIVEGGVTTPEFPEATSNITVGLPYRARFKSAKLGVQSANGALLFGSARRVVDLALILANTHAKGIRFGPDFDTLDDRPQRDEWADVDADNIDTDYDKEPVGFPGGWSEDSRLCLQAQAPRPCTVLAAQIGMEV